VDEKSAENLHARSTGGVGTASLEMVLESTITSVLQSQPSKSYLYVRFQSRTFRSSDPPGPRKLTAFLPPTWEQGHAGRLRVDVPWISLGSKPVDVYIEDVHLTAGKKHTLDEGTPAPEKKPVTDPTGSELKSPESTPAGDGSAVDGDPWHESFIFRLAANIRVEINGICTSIYLPDGGRYGVALTCPHVRSLLPH